MSLDPSFDRRSGIGASLAPVVCGLSPWSSPLEVYAFLIGAKDGPPETPEMAWGTAIEGAILDHARRHFDQPISYAPPTRRHPVHRHVFASPDGVLRDGRGFEMKNVGRFHSKDWGEEGGDQVPRYVLVQCQQQMAVYGFPAVEVAASLCGAPPAYYTVPRSDALIDVLITDWLTPFWERVKRRDAPQPDWEDPRTPELVALLHRPLAGKVVELPEAEGLVGLYQTLGEEIGVRAKERDRARARLIEMMGDAETGLLPDGRRVRRRPVEVKERVQQGYNYFNFSITKKERTT